MTRHLHSCFQKVSIEEFSVLFSINKKILEKFLNLFGCPLRVVTMERCPSMCYEKRKRYSGYDYEIIQTIRERLNMTVELKYLNGSQQWGTILPNGTGIGALGVLQRGEADISIGNFFLQLSRLTYFDHTFPYLTVPLVLVVPPRK